MSKTKRPVSEGGEKLLDLYFPVLDHGFIALKDYCGSDAAIAQAARCSYGAGTRSISDDRNLIRYLVRHKHTSPLEQVEIKLHIKAPIFVFRQWIRHRTASLNEASGRYSVMPLQFYTPEEGVVCIQSSSNKQGRGEPVKSSIYEKFCNFLNINRQHVKHGYVDSLSHDIARELARIDLPLSTYSEMYWKMDLHNLMHFLTLRCDGHAQYEIRAFSDIIAGIIKEVVPISYDAWIDYDYMSENFSYQEMLALLSMMDDLSCLGQNKEDYISIHEKDDEYGVEFGLSKREVREFFDKLKFRSRVDYQLDLSTSKTPEYFQQEAAKYVPII